MTPHRKGGPSGWKRGVIHCALWVAEGEWMAMLDVVSSVMRFSVGEDDEVEGQ